MKHKNIIKPAVATFVLFLMLFSVNSQQLEYLELIDNEWVINKEKYTNYLQNHPYNTRSSMTKEELKAIPKYDRPDLAYEHDWLITHDLMTGTIPWQRLIPVLKTLYASNNSIQTTAPGGGTSNNWVERGPNNIGGRTRAIMFDPTDATNKKVFAGGVGGGLWYNNDITSSTASWNSVNDFWTNLAVSSIAYDPTADTVFYVGTGEGWFNGGAMRGAGIWKSTNAGTSFVQLSSTNNTSFTTVQKVVVLSTGRIIAVTNGGIYTSDNDGVGFTRRRSGFHADIEVGANGDIYATGGRINSTGKVYKSINDGTAWTDITPSGGSPERIELACAPSDSNTIYAVASNYPTTAGTDVEWFKKSTNGGSSWTNVTIPTYLSNSSKHFTRGQAWYDLILWVHPTDKNVVIAGGIDLHRSTNGGTSWTSISYWNTSQSKPVVHADQHNVISRPGNNNEILIGNDGGVYYSANAGNKNNSAPTFSNRVKGYNVTQFYSAAVHPSSGSNYMLAGAQDNGSLKLNTAGVGAGTEVTGGDGAFCFIDQDNSSYQITSYIRNNWRRSTNGGISFSIIQSANDGSFINPADYDDNKNILYAAKSATQLNRITNMTSGSVSTGTITISGMSGTATHVRVSPYTTASSTLFVGSSGDVFKVSSADGSSPTASKISPASFPSGTVSCVEIGASENELLVTFSNYGSSTVSVWYTANGGTTWVNKEGNLPDMPVRWAMFNPKNRKEVILATELGVYATTDILASTVSWSSSSKGMAITRVDMFQYRAVDSLIMASTHGRGVFTGRFKTAVIPPSSIPVVNFGADKTTICIGESVTFSDSTTNSPTALRWTFTGGTPLTSAATNPVVTYLTAGTYAVKLKATNANGSDSLTKTAFISVNAAPNAVLGAFSALCTNSPTQTLAGGTPTGGAYFIDGTLSTTIDPSTLSAGSHTIKYRVQIGNCADSASQSVIINTAPNVATSSIPPVCITNPSFTLKNGTPTGGTYSGLGVSSGTFDPTAAGTGTKVIKYLVTNSNGCADSSQFNIVVNAAPIASLSAIGPYCTGSAVDTLTNGTPVGGTYSGSGVSGSTFNPATAMAGTHVLSYKVQVGTCSDSTTINVVVNNGPSVSVSAIPAVCENSPSFTLINGLPVRGIYTGLGVSSGMFTPATAGSGTKSIKYKVTSSNGCADSAQFNIVVNAAPTASLSAIGPFCTSSSSVTLTNGLPVGGVYSGVGVSTGTFDPSIAGVGTHTLKYVFSNLSSCTDSSTISVIVGSGLTATLDSLSSVCTDTSFTLNGGKPIGGNYSGPGVAGGIFSANTAGSGIHTIVYTTNSACGISAASRSILVDSVPTVSVVKSLQDCIGSLFNFKATGATNYSWSPAIGLSNATIGNPSLLITSSLTYILTSSHNNGCVIKDTIDVTALSTPNVKANIDLSVCIGDTFQLNASGANSYTWVPSTGLNNSTIANPQGVLTGSITYFLTGKDTGKCVGIDTVNVDVKPKSVVTHSPISDVCLMSDPFALFGGTPVGGTYIGPGVTRSKFDPSSAGVGFHTITYFASDSGKCIAKTTVTINVLLSPNVVWNVPNTICENEGALIMVSTPIGGKYGGTGVSGDQFNPTIAGLGFHEITYNLTVSGCVSNEKREIEVVPGSVVNPISGLTNVTKKGKYNYQVKAINGSGYSWFVTGGALLSNANNISAIQWGTANTGKIILVQTNTYGCTDTTELLVNVNALSIGDEVTLGGGVVLYPNPADKTVSLKIDAKYNEDVQIRLFNNSGQQILDKSGVTRNEEMFEINIAEFPSGLYLIQAEIGNTAYSAALVIKH